MLYTNPTLWPDIHRLYQLARCGSISNTDAEFLWVYLFFCICDEVSHWLSLKHFPAMKAFSVELCKDLKDSISCPLFTFQAADAQLVNIV